MEAFTHTISNLTGIVPPMFIPFGDDDRIDCSALSQEAIFLRRSGASGIVVGGSMGEGAGLSEGELVEALRIVIQAVNDDIPVLAGVIADTSREAVRLAKAARDAGAAGLQVPPPHFHRTANTAVLGSYYQAITDNSELPLIIYNVMPAAQAAVDSLCELMESNPKIVGVKQSGRNIHTLAALLAVLRGKVRIFSAIDDMIYPTFMLGVDGAISGTTAIFPREILKMFQFVQCGEFDEALKLHERIAPIWRIVEQPTLPGLAKYVTQLTGRKIGNPRRPFSWPDSNLAQSIELAMRASGFMSDDIALQSENLQPTP